MTQKDIEILRKFLSDLKDKGYTGGSVLLCSPSDEQIDAFMEYFDHVLIDYRADWDITQGPTSPVNLIYFGNVMHYIKEPGPALENIKKSCSFFIIQDLTYRKRSADYELGEDGDCMRYSIGDQKAELDNSYDLNTERIIHKELYKDLDSKHFIALLRGNL